MIDLNLRISENARILREAWTGLIALPRTSLPAKCWERWIKRAELHRLLGETAEILPARQVAWDAVQAVSAATNLDGARPNTIGYGGVNVDFSIARHLALISYVAVTWSIYDRLANFCGRLAGVADLAENPKQNPKACEDFLGKKDVMGFSGHVHIQQAYAWPLRVSYKMRNWLVHEGHEEGGIRLFEGGTIADGFILHSDGVAHLERSCGYSVDDGKIEFGCISAVDECWPSRNVLVILERYHAEIDLMFSSMIKWSTASFVGQIQCFTERDS